MSIATRPKPDGFLQKFTSFQTVRLSAQRAQRRLDLALRSRNPSAQEIARLQDEAETLWTQSDRVGSEFARAKQKAFA